MTKIEQDWEDWKNEKKKENNQGKNDKKWRIEIFCQK